MNGLDGEPIWESPTDGEPLDLRWLPSGVQGVVAVAPARLAAHREWPKLADTRTMGGVADWLNELPGIVGAPLAKIDELIVGIMELPLGAGGPAMVARLTEAVPEEELVAAWGPVASETFQAETLGGKTFYLQDQRSWYLPAEGEGRLIVIAPREEIEAIVAGGGERAALRRELEVLLDSSDDERHLTAAMASSLMFGVGQAPAGAAAGRLHQGLEQFLTLLDSQQRPDIPKAVMLSVHLGDNLFLEARVYNSLAGKASPMVARALRERVARLPRSVSGYLRDVSLSAYSKEVLWDFPDRLEVLDAYTRGGSEGQQAVLRAYLPAVAAHNLVLGGHLALLETPGKASGPTMAGYPAERAGEGLDKVTSLSFPSNTLEAAIAMLSEDVGIEMVIMGGDLETQGITKNQSFDLDERNLPAGEILRRILKEADPAGRLVYVNKPKKEGGPPVLHITTREAAVKRGDPLPAELQ